MEKEAQIAILRKEMESKKYNRVPDNVKNRYQKQLEKFEQEMEKVRHLTERIQLVLSKSTM